MNRRGILTAGASPGRAQLSAERRLGPARRRILNTVVDVVYLAIMGHLCWIGYKTVLRTWNNEAVTLPVSDAVLYAAFLLASLFILVRIAARIRSRFSAGDDMAHPEASS